MTRYTTPAVPLLLAVLLVQGGCKKDDKADTNPPGGQGAKDGGKTPPGPPVEVGSEQLAKEYATDPRAADARYKNKLLQVQGKVVYADYLVTRNQIHLSGYKEKPTGDPFKGAVRCAVRPELKDKIPLLSKGQMLQVTGTCKGGGANGVDLADCEFKELEPSSIITISAEALTSGFAAAGKNDLSVHKKYNDKGLIVEGTVVDLDLKHVVPRVTLAGQAPWTVSCKGTRKDLQQLKKGQQVRIRGLYEGYTDTGHRIDLGGALPLPLK